MLDTMSVLLRFLWWLRLTLCLRVVPPNVEILYVIILYFVMLRNFVTMPILRNRGEGRYNYAAHALL